ncbi:hypothetical protein B0H11DRAFT_2003542 [Mycena galericulata]|nr:hypothetical protein B0H11DRAFT_2003542 [Mycena galericulata]
MATMETNFQMHKWTALVPDVPQTTESINNCPPPTRIFHGQQGVLDKMHKYFSQDLGKQHIFLLHGLGGAGKTQIALKFIQEASFFSDSFHVDTSTPQTISAGLKDIAIKKRIGNTPEDALNWLRSTANEWLLFFDNADDPTVNLNNYFPQCNHGSILITSRNPGLCVYAGSHSLISDMEEADAAVLLLRSAVQETTPKNQEISAQIVKALCYFPLAIIQAGASIAKSGSLDSYLALFTENRTRLLSKKPAQSHDNYAWTVYTTWQISFKQLSPGSQKLLQLCSFLHHQGISEEIFSKASLYTFPLAGPSQAELKGATEFLSQFLGPTGTWESLLFTDLTNQLRAYSLINLTSETRLFSIHPLVHSWSQTTIEDQKFYHSVMAAIVGMSIASIHSADLKYAGLQLLPHVDSLLHGETQITPDFNYEYGNIYYSSGQLKKALNFIVAVVETRKKKLGEDHPDTLHSMSNVAATYGELGELHRAQVIYSIVLKKQKTLLGEDHPETLRTMGYQAYMYRWLGKLSEAEKLDTVVLERQRSILGDEHRETLSTMSSLVATYQKQGRLKEAKTIVTTVLEKQKSLFGEDHPAIFRSMRQLAHIYRDLGEWRKAKELQIVVLGKQKQILGGNHPETLITMMNLGFTYRELGQSREAERLAITVLEQLHKTLGADHPDTLHAMGNLAMSYHQLGQLKNAEALEVVVLQKRQEIFGEEHRDTFWTMRNLASTYYELGRLDEAAELEVVVFEKQRKILGEYHPDTLLSMGNLARTYLKLGRLNEAEDLGSVVLKKRKQVLGEDHPHSLLATGDLAHIYQKLGQWKEAEELQVAVLEKQSRILGNTHPHTLVTRQRLKETYQQLGRMEDAKSMDFEQVEGHEVSLIV